MLDSTDGVEIEKVAAQQPDLILGVYSGITEKEYDALSKLAPVVAQPKGKPDYGTSWQEETLITGQAIGKPDEAQQLVDDTEQLIDDTAAEYPDLAGQTAAMVADYQGVFVYGPQDVRSRLLVELGMTYPEPLRDAFPKAFGGQLSDEKTDALDVGVLVWFADGDRSKDADQGRRALRQAEGQPGGPRRLHRREGSRLRRDVLRVRAEHADADGGAGPAARRGGRRRPGDVDGPVGLAGPEPHAGASRPSGAPLGSAADLNLARGFSCGDSAWLRSVLRHCSPPRQQRGHRSRSSASRRTARRRSATTRAGTSTG